MIWLKSARRFLLLAPFSLLLLANTCSNEIFGGPPPSTPTSEFTPLPGAVGAVVVSQYNNTWSGTCEGYQNTDATQSQLDSAQSDFMTGLPGWSRVLTSTEGAVTANTFGSSTQNNADALAFFGHGTEGAVAFTAANTFWGVGPANGVDEAQCTNIANTQGLPIQGRLKWLFLFSSDSAAGPATLDPTDTLYTANWSPAFGGSLHGIYGFWEHPTATGGNAADITADQTDPIAQAFDSNVTGPSPVSVHYAWINAANTSNAGAGDQWAIWEEASNLVDVLSGPGNGDPTPNGHLYFYYPLNGQEQTTGPVSVGQNTYTLGTTGLAPAVSINDSSEASTIKSDDSTATQTTQGANPMVYDAGFTVVHRDSDSGAVITEAASDTNAVGFTASAAQTAAQGYIAQTLAMPSDAVLDHYLTFNQYDTSAHTNVVTGYEFIYKHSNGIYGGDAIKVIVDDYQTSTRQCTGGFTDPDPPLKPICLGWSIIVAHTPHINYSYYLWRETSGTSGTSTNGVKRRAESGSKSITAYTASLSLPKGFVVTAYVAGLWTEGANTPNSTADGTVPAWIFSDGTARMAVDAYTGALLGPA